MIQTSFRDGSGVNFFSGFQYFFLKAIFRSTCDVILFAQGKVASVNTFEACCDVLKTSSPVWALFENVTSIDREVDPDVNLSLFICTSSPGLTQTMM